MPLLEGRRENTARARHPASPTFSATEAGRIPRLDGTGPGAKVGVKLELGAHHFPPTFGIKRLFRLGSKPWDHDLWS